MVDIWLFKYDVVVFSAASDVTVLMDAAVASIAVCIPVADADRIDATDAIATTRALFSTWRPVLSNPFAEVNDDFTASMDVVNEVSEPMRFAYSVESVVFNAESVAVRDVEALPSSVPTAAIDATRTLISLARVVASVPFVAVKAASTPANEEDTDAMDAL